MKKILQLLPLLILAGCVTNGLSMRAIRDPETKLDKSSKIHIDPYRDTAIEYRNAMSEAIDVAKDLGMNVVPYDEADYVMYLNYRKNLQYNSRRNEFEQHAFVRVKSTEVQLRSSSGVSFGVINAGVYEVGGSNRTQWEGSIEVRDLNDKDEAYASLKELLSRFSENFRGEVQGQVYED